MVSESPVGPVPFIAIVDMMRVLAAGMMWFLAAGMTWFLALGLTWFLSAEMMWSHQKLYKPDKDQI